jgi:hypothetical protein
MQYFAALCATTKSLVSGESMSQEVLSQPYAVPILKV